MHDLTRKMVKGAAWMVLARIFDRSIALVSTLILARLLVPGDFGLVSLAVAILAGLELLGAFSFDMALIQNQHADRSHYDTVWTMQLLFAAFFAVALLVLAYPAARFFDEPRLAAVMQWLSFGTLIGGLSNVGVVAFRKELDMAKEFTLLFAKRVVLFSVTVTLAFLWRDYWALVAGTVTGMIAGVLISYRMHPYRPRLCLEKWRELYGFSRWLFLNNTLGFLYTKAADLIVAKSIDTTSLGYYSLAYEISNMPSSELVMPINRAVFPGYSKMSSDVASLRQGYLNVISMVVLFAVPASVGLGCIALPMVTVLLGTKWLSIVPLIPVLAIFGMLTAVMGCGHYALLAAGRPRDVTVLLATRAGIAVPMLALSVVKWGILGAAWALLLSSVLLLPLNHYFLWATLRVQTKDLLRTHWRPTIATIVMAVVLYWVQLAYSFGTDFFGQVQALVLLVAIGGVTYGGTVLGLWVLAKRPNGAERFLLDRIAQRTGLSLR